MRSTVLPTTPVRLSRSPAVEPLDGLAVTPMMMSPPTGTSRLLIWPSHRLKARNPPPPPSATVATRAPRVAGRSMASASPPCAADADVRVLELAVCDELRHDLRHDGRRQANPMPADA
jgi:hypothetical protein